MLEHNLDNSLWCTEQTSWSLQLIYLGVNANGTIPLAAFVAIFGAVMIVLAQLPSFHSLRYINLVSLLLCLTYSLCATAGSVLAGIMVFLTLASWSSMWTFQFFLCRHIPEYIILFCFLFALLWSFLLWGACLIFDSWCNWIAHWNVV